MKFEWDDNKNAINRQGKTRIISARKATLKERKKYYEYLQPTTQ